jgi:hypothetical protein
LLGSASALALPFAAAFAPAQATGLPPGTTLSLEGGGACPTSDDGTFLTTYTYEAGFFTAQPTGLAQFGSAGCGWTGRIGLFQERPGAVFGFGDFWGVFVRHQEFKSSRFKTGDTDKYFQITSAGSFDEDRTVVDFEVGKDIGIGSDGSKLRLFGGIRYAHYSSSLNASGDTGGECDFECKYGYAFGIHAGQTFNGVGPRLGVTGQLPLFGGLFLTGSVSGSVLWGDHQVNLSASGFDFGRRKFSGDDVVTNAEGEVGVGLPFFSTRGTLIVGARWEGWFDQNKYKNYVVDVAFDCECVGLVGDFTGKGSLDRNNWGPFLRLNIPLGPAPPPPP